MLIIIVNIGLFSEEVEDYSKDRKWTIQTSPGFYLMNIASLAAGDLFIVDLEGQYKINHIFNVSLTLSFMTSFWYTDNLMVNIKPMFIYRPLKTGLKGFYLGLYPIFGIMNTGNYYYGYDITYEVGFGLNLGYKWILKNGFTIQWGSGIGKTWSDDKFMNFSSDGRLLFKYLDIFPIDFKIGYSF